MLAQAHDRADEQHIMYRSGLNPEKPTQVSVLPCLTRLVALQVTAIDVATRRRRTSSRSHAQPCPCLIAGHLHAPSAPCTPPARAWPRSASVCARCACACLWPWPCPSAGACPFCQALPGCLHIPIKGRLWQLYVGQAVLLRCKQRQQHLAVWRHLPTSQCWAAQRMAANKR